MKTRKSGVKEQSTQSSRQLNKLQCAGNVCVSCQLPSSASFSQFNIVMIYELELSEATRVANLKNNISALSSDFFLLSLPKKLNRAAELNDLHKKLTCAGKVSN